MTPQKKPSRASTLASGRRRMDLSAQPPPSSSSQKGNGLKKWQVLIITSVNPRPPPSPTLCPLRAPALPPGLCVSGRIFLPAVPWMAPHQTWLRMGVSGVTAEGVWAGAGTARPQCRGVGVMGSRDTARSRARAVRPRSRSEPAPSQIADGDKKLIAGFCCTWQERGRAAAPSLPSSCSHWSSAPPVGTSSRLPAR